MPDVERDFQDRVQILADMDAALDEAADVLAQAGLSSAPIDHSAICTHSGIDFAPTLHLRRGGRDSRGNEDCSRETTKYGPTARRTGCYILQVAYLPANH